MFPNYRVRVRREEVNFSEFGLHLVIKIADFSLLVSVNECFGFSQRAP